MAQILKLYSERIALAIITCSLTVLLAGCGLPSPTPIIRSSPTPSSLPNLAPTRTAIPAPPATATVQPTSVLPTATPQPAPQGKILVWAHNNPDTNTFLRGIADDFQKLYPAVGIELRQLDPETFNSQLNETGQDGPQILLAPANMAGEWQRAKLILPLDRFFEAKFFQQFVPEVLQGVRDDNQFWGVPFNFGHSLALFYNKKLVNLDKIPASWEGMTAFVRANPAKPGEFYPFSADLFEPNFLLGVLSAHGGTTFNQNNQPTLNTPEMRQSLQFLQDAIFKNKLVPAEPTYLQMQLLFRTGRLAMLLADSDNLPEYQKPEWSSRLEVGIGRIPQINGRTPIMPSAGLAYFLGSSADDNPARLSAVRLFLAFASLPEQQRKLVNSLKILPPTNTTLADPVVKSEPFLGALAVQFQSTRALLPSPLSKTILEAMRLPINNVVWSRASAAEGAAAMQDLALQKLKRN